MNKKLLKWFGVFGRASLVIGSTKFLAGPVLYSFRYSFSGVWYWLAIGLGVAATISGVMEIVACQMRDENWRDEDSAYYMAFFLSFIGALYVKRTTALVVLLIDAVILTSIWIAPTWVPLDWGLVALCVLLVGSAFWRAWYVSRVARRICDAAAPSA